MLHRHKDQFTLVELLTLIAIVAILGALLLPLLQQSMNSSRTAACANTVRQLGVVATCYSDMNNGFFTITPYENNLLTNYTDRVMAGGRGPTAPHANPNDLAYCPNYRDEIHVWYRPSGYLESSPGTYLQTPRFPQGHIGAGPSSRYWKYVSYCVNQWLSFPGARVSRIQKPSRTFLFMEAWDSSNSQIQLLVQLYFNPRHQHRATVGHVDGSVELRPDLATDQSPPPINGNSFRWYVESGGYKQQMVHDWAIYLSSKY